MTVYSAVSATLGVTITEISGIAVLTLTGPATVVEDTAYTYSGKLTGTGGVGLVGASIAMSYMSGTVETQLGSVATGTGGNYSYNVTFANQGLVSLIARWAGGSGWPSA